MSKLLKIIVCCDNNYGIGNGNDLPWKIKSEMEIFKKKTIGNGNNCVIMGSKTYMSIPSQFRPLKERMNYVMTNNKDIINDIKDKDKVAILSDYHDLLNILKRGIHDEYWLIGGESLYVFILTHFSLLVDEIHITIIHKKYDCNKFFPKLVDNYTILERNVNEEENYTHMVLKSICNRNKDYL